MNPPRDVPRDWRRHALVAAMLAGAILLAYAAAPSQQFVNYDDLDFVPENPHVAAGLSVDNVLWAFEPFTPSMWHPLTWISFMLDAQIDAAVRPADAPLRPIVFKLTNLLLHTANTLLLLAVLVRLTGAYWRSVAVALLFALHPLNVESVAWISERKNVLSMLLALLTVLLYARYARTPTAGRYLPVMATFALGLMAKPALVPLPMALLLLDVWPLRRVELLPRAWRRLALLAAEKLPLLALSMGSSAMTVWNHHVVGAMAADMPVAIRLQNVPISYVRYVLAMVFPVDLAPYYPFESQWPVSASLAAAAILLGVTVLALRWWRSQGWLFTGWLWYLGMLVPMIGLVQAGGQAMADRYFYVSGVGLLLIAVWSGHALLARWLPRAGVAVTGGLALTIVAAACLTATRSRVNDWADSLTLWGKAWPVTRTSGVMTHALGQAWDKAGHPRRAVILYSEAVRWRPDDTRLALMLADAAVRAGHDALAQRTLVRLSQGPGSAVEPAVRVEALRLLAMLAQRQGQWAPALRAYDDALALAPDAIDLHLNRGKVLLRMGREPEAAAAFERVLSSEPRQVDALEQMGLLMARLDRLPDAAGYYQRALAESPGRASLHNNLGVALARMGQWPAAAAAFERAVALDPQLADARANLQRVRTMTTPADSANPRPAP